MYAVDDQNVFSSKMRKITFAIKFKKQKNAVYLCAYVE